MLRVDLEAAGIPYRDDSGRVCDFYSLRLTFITLRAMSSTPVKSVQSLARHSTPVLTLERYAHVSLHGQSASLNALPALNPSNTPPRTEAAILARTGADGPILAAHGQRAGVGTERFESDTDGNADVFPPSPSRRKAKPETG
ncbi:hypothetical protein [Tautonia marina]|uniref:hypothetical protein n=1 Tax=Tautonia marina TaxID=2653855 RepID=UPI0012612D35|nr:hypothetical protein [Tautonia marina]